MDFGSLAESSSHAIHQKNSRLPGQGDEALSMRPIAAAVAVNFERLRRSGPLCSRWRPRQGSLYSCTLRSMQMEATARVGATKLRLCQSWAPPCIMAIRGNSAELGRPEPGTAARGSWRRWPCGSWVNAAPAIGHNPP
jgi:hypothetical protein